MTDSEKMMVRRRRLVRFAEFFIVGLLMGVSEDLMAIYFATGESITIHIFIIASAVSLPFAFFSEMVVDHPDFWPRVLRKLKAKESR